METVKEVKTAEEFLLDHWGHPLPAMEAYAEYRASLQNAELKKENKALQIQASNYAYQMDRAKQERDKAEAENAELKKENERLRNDLLDALDLKQGNGPTALSMVKAENSRLREALTNCRQMILWHLEHSEPQHDDYSAAFLNNSKWAVDKAGQALNPSTK